MGPLKIAALLLVVALSPTVTHASCPTCDATGTGYSNTLVTFDGFAFKSNGTKCIGTGCGDYQCVAGVKNFYAQAGGFSGVPNHAITTPWDIAANAFSRADPTLTAYPNGQTGTIPRPGDILCFGSGSDPNDPTYSNSGHVAIISKVTSDHVYIVDQNRTTSASRENLPLALTYSGGHYSVSSFYSPHYVTQGWMRNTGYVPPGSDASPAPDPLPDPPPTTYLDSWSTQTPHVITLQRGQTATFSVTFVNSGSGIWKGGTTSPTDPNYIELRSCDTHSDGSTHPSWLYYPGVNGVGGWISTTSVTTCKEATVSHLGTATFTFTVQVPRLQTTTPTTPYQEYFRLHHNTGGDLNTPGGYYDGYYVAVTVIPKVKYDFDGDGKSDIVFLDKRDTGYLRVDLSNNGFWPLDASYPNYGTAPGIWACPGDFNGDFIADFAQINPAYSNGMFQINEGPNLVDGFTQNYDNYGTGTLIPVVADFDGDGKDDYSQFEPATGYWRVNYATNFANGFDLMLPYYGNWGFTPCAGDFDGDGMADLLMIDRWHGVVYISYASNGFTSGYDNLPGYPNYGVSDAIVPMAGDVNGDGYDDYVQYDTDTGVLHINLGGSIASGSIANGFEYNLSGYPSGAGINPWMGDFNGDGKADLLVYMQSTWTIGIDYASAGANLGFNGLEEFHTYFDQNGNSAQPAPPDEDHPPKQLSFSLTTVPNPTQSSVGINFTLPVADRVTMSICDVSGREVARFAEELYGVGMHTLSWNRTSPRGGRVANGVYFLTFRSALHTVSKKIVVLN